MGYRYVDRIDAREGPGPGRLLPRTSQRALFPGVDIIPTGYAVYRVALNKLMHNIVQNGNNALSDALLDLDRLCP